MRLCPMLALLCGCCMLAPTVAQAGFPSEREALIQEARAAMRVADFERVQRRRQELLTSQELTSAGIRKIELYDKGLADAIDDSIQESHFKYWDALTEKWTKQYPSSTLARLLHVNALTGYAWFYRGHEYASKVSDLAWQPYREYMQKAATYVLEQGETTRSDPGWYVLALSVGLQVGWSEEKMNKIVDEGIRKFPNDLRIYDVGVLANIPKWGGDAQKLDAFIRRAAKGAPDKREGEFYARMYDQAAHWQYGWSLYRDSRVDWNVMKKGLEDWNRRFPSTWSKQVFAAHACGAGDRQTAARLLKDLVADEEIEAWKANGRAMFEQCKQWALGAPQERLPGKKGV